MKTVVVALAKDSIDLNVHLFPLFLTANVRAQDVRIIVHQDPEYRATGSGYETNYDILIDGSVGLKEEYADLATVYFKSHRLSKSRQHLKLTEVAKKLKDDNFLVPRMFSLNNDYSWLYGSLEDIQKVLVKSDYGARGIRQAVIERKRGYSFQKFFSELVDKYKQVEGKAIEVSKSKFADTLELDSGTLYNLKGIERPEEDSLEILFRDLSAGTVGVYEYIDDIKTEWRIWTDLNCNPFIIGERVLEKRSGDHPQATYITKMVHVSELPSKVTDLLRLLNLQQSSVDVFKTKSGKWGIFEWQGQTGTNSVPQETVNLWIRNFLEGLVAKYLDIT